MDPQTNTNLSAAINNVVLLLLGSDPRQPLGESETTELQSVYRAVLHHATGVPMPEDLASAGLTTAHLVDRIEYTTADGTTLRYAKPHLAGLLDKVEGQLQTYTAAAQELSDTWEKLNHFQVV